MEKTDDILLSALDKAAEHIGKTPTTSDKFRDTMLAASRTDGSKPIHYPAEILLPRIDHRLRGGSWTAAGSRTLSAIIVGVDLASPETVAELRTLQSQHAELRAKQAAFSLKKANAAFENQRKSLVEQAVAGNLPGAAESQWRERESIQTDFRNRWHAFDAVLCKISRTAADLILPIWTKISDAAFTSMQEMEKTERAAAEKFDVPWQPSAIYRVHATILQHCQKRIEALRHFQRGENGFSHFAPADAVENLIPIQ